MQQSQKVLTQIVTYMCHFGSPQVDLIRSIGESAALGAAGCVLWGSSYDFNNKVLFLVIFIMTKTLAFHKNQRNGRS